MSDSSSAPAVAADDRSATRKMVLAALGVVFGDIGTSPLYAFRECLSPAHGIPTNEASILGLLSLIVWSLLLVISVKYVGFVLRADNRGEGGVLALSTLLSTATKDWRLWKPVSAVGVFGAALFFGDGFITPAISVLSAMEGLTIATPRLEHFVLPGALLILVSLFLIQRRGTGAMGRMFGPITLIWFITLGLLGLRWIITAPHVLLAINPLYAFNFFVQNGSAAFVVLASVFLAVTGGEALYADMGHFGRAPIRRGWFLIVLPALVLNYFGQGALLIEHPEAIVNPFYKLAPGWLLPILIVLAAAATVIASQAVISGVFSVARQALNLGYLPRLRVLHSSSDEIGQIYVPSLNWVLLAGTVMLVLAFRSSSALAGAYGIAIASTMLIDGVLVIMLLRVRKARHYRLSTAILGFIVAIELAFLLSNTLKFSHGGWLPIAGAVLVYILMTTWQEGRRTLNWLIAKEQMPVRDFLTMIEKDAHPRRCHRRLSCERGRRHSARAAQQPAVQPGAARPQYPADLRAPGSAVRHAGGSHRSADTRTGPVPCDRALRLHGNAECRRRDAQRRRERHPVRTGADRVRGRPRESGVCHRLRHAAVAQAPVRLHGPQQPACGSSFRCSATPHAGGQQPGAAVRKTAAMRAISARC